MENTVIEDREVVLEKDDSLSDMKVDVIYNDDCMVTMEKSIAPHNVDIVLTSPPYCTSNRAGKSSSATLKNTYSSGYPSYRYDVFIDNMPPDEYVDWNIRLFKLFDVILKENGCVIYNISYSSVNRDAMFRVISHILEETNFSLADMIGWKKSSALPNNTSSNKLTRIFEPVFVFCRKSEVDTFRCNKRVVSVRERTGQKMYENVFNFIEAKNNDGVCKLNRATYSTELCERLLGIYGCRGMTVYDPFMGTGTTAVACKRFGMHYIGSELSSEQIAFANDRIAKDDGVLKYFGVEETVHKAVKAKASKKKKQQKRAVGIKFIQDELFTTDLTPKLNFQAENGTIGE